jgi:hypothetical protein
VLGGRHAILQHGPITRMVEAVYHFSAKFSDKCHLMMMMFWEEKAPRRCYFITARCLIFVLCLFNSLSLSVESSF